MKMLKQLPVLIALALLFSCDDQMDDCPIGNFNLSVTSVTNTPCNTEGGSITVDLDISTNEVITFSLDGGTPQEENTFNGLSVGTYTITAQSSQGCMATVEADVLLDTVSISLVKVIDSRCDDTSGQIEVAVSLPGYRFSIDGINYQESGVFADLAPGAYTLEARNDAGCNAILEVVVASGVSFQNTIKNIIDTNCAITGCHSADSPNPTKLATLSNVQSLADRVKARTSRKTMPPGGRTISQREIDLIACWVDDGAPSN